MLYRAYQIIWLWVIEQTLNMKVFGILERTFIYLKTIWKYDNGTNSIQLFVVEFDTCLLWIWELLLLSSNARTAPNLPYLKMATLAGVISAIWIRAIRLYRDGIGSDWKVAFSIFLPLQEGGRRENATFQSLPTPSRYSTFVNPQHCHIIRHAL